ncbi:MAG: ABC transporter substrate-binding protein [Planctomycetota bacterium]|nr:MAG: ABC transporter substrate-binding protein [Planctomycetota bacterium]
MRWAAALGAALLAGSGCDCTGGGGSAAARQAVFVYARGADAVTLDPQKIDDGESVLVAANLFEGLVRYAEEGVALEPALATRWERSSDGLRWTFELRSGVRFHDGEPFDAEAVAYTFRRILDPQHPQHDAEILNEALYADIAAVEVLDPHRVRFRLRRPVAPELFLGNLAVYTAFIVPPRALARDPVGFGRRPVGTGPFILERWQADQRIELRANPQYWGGAPAIERAVVLAIKENSSRRQLLESGQVHAIDGVNPVDVERLRGLPGVEVLVEPGMSVGYLAFNCRRPPLDRPEVRRALALAIDREAIVRLNFHGLAAPAVQITPPSVLPPPAGAAPPRRDLAQARRLLAGAGLAPEALRFTLWAMPNPRPYLPEPKKTAQLIQDQLGELGVRCEIVTYPWDVYLNKTRQGEHDLCLLGWTADVADPDNFLFVFFHSANRGGTNFSFFSDAALDERLVAAQLEGDPAARRRSYLEIEARLRELVPLVPLVHPQQLGAQRAGLRGLRLHPTGRKLFHRVQFAEP